MWTFAEIYANYSNKVTAIFDVACSHLLPITIPFVNITVTGKVKINTEIKILRQILGKWVFELHWYFQDWGFTLETLSALLLMLEKQNVAKIKNTFLSVLAVGWGFFNDAVKLCDLRYLFTLQLKIQNSSLYFSFIKTQSSVL